MEFRGRPAKASRSDSGGRRKGLNNFREYYAPGKGSLDQTTLTSIFIQRFKDSTTFFTNNGVEK